MSTTPPPPWKHQKHVQSTAFAMINFFCSDIYFCLDIYFDLPRHLHLGDVADSFAERVSSSVVVDQNQHLFHWLCTYNQPRISNLFSRWMCAHSVCATTTYNQSRISNLFPDGCVRTLCALLLHIINQSRISNLFPDGCVRTLCALLHDNRCAQTDRRQSIQ